MAKTLNRKAEAFVMRYLFLAEPEKHHPNASVAVAKMVEDWIEFDNAPDEEFRTRSRAMLKAVSRMVDEGDVFGELSRGGVLFVRLSPQGVMEPTKWSCLPQWFSERPELVAWAERKLHEQAVLAGG